MKFKKTINRILQNISESKKSDNQITFKYQGYDKKFKGKTITVYVSKTGRGKGYVYWDDLDGLEHDASKEDIEAMIQNIRVWHDVKSDNINWVK